MMDNVANGGLSAQTRARAPMTPALRDAIPSLCSGNRAR